MLYKIHSHCCRAKLNKWNLPVGGLFVYIFGNFDQLPRVAGTDLYSAVENRN